MALKIKRADRREMVRLFKWAKRSGIGQVKVEMDGDDGVVDTEGAQGDCFNDWSDNLAGYFCELAEKISLENYPRWADDDGGEMVVYFEITEGGVEAYPWKWRLCRGKQRAAKLLKAN